MSGVARNVRKLMEADAKRDDTDDVVVGDAFTGAADRDYHSALTTVGALLAQRLARVEAPDVYAVWGNTR